MELSEALGDSHVREIEEERDRALLLRFLVVGDERRGDGACRCDPLVWGYNRGKMRPALALTSLRHS